MDGFHRLLGLCAAAATVLLLVKAVQREYPREYEVMRWKVLELERRAEALHRYVHAPAWLQEMAQVRGLAPGDVSEPL